MMLIGKGEWLISLINAKTSVKRMEMARLYPMEGYGKISQQRQSR